MRDEPLRMALKTLDGLSKQFRGVHGRSFMKDFEEVVSRVSKFSTSKRAFPCCGAEMRGF